MMKKFILTLFAISLLIDQLQADVSPLILGQVVKINSACLREERKLNVYLPPSYDTGKNYPVIYLLDGSLDEDFVHVTGLLQFFNLMHGMRECIVVGITNVDRKRDFTFTPGKSLYNVNHPSSGHSDSFIAFLEKELQPYVQAHYKTSAERMLIGQSLGGLVATEILLKKPHLFTHYFIVSPSLWWDNGSLLKQANELLKTHSEGPKFVYISAGANEPRIMRRDARRLYKILKRHQRSQTRVVSSRMKHEDHATILHNSIYRGFLELLKSGSL